VISAFASTDTDKKLAEFFAAPAIGKAARLQSNAQQPFPPGAVPGL
jgi:hypothetical protein